MLFLTKVLVMIMCFETTVFKASRSTRSTRNFDISDMDELLAVKKENKGVLVKREASNKNILEAK